MKLSCAEPIVVHLKPPCLDDVVLMEGARNRPRRLAGVNISLEEKEKHTILHCYGHGGFGITTLFGSVQKAIELLQATHPSLDSKVCIIGSGCMGLALAAELGTLGFTNIIIYTKDRDHNISWVAGGFFDPGVGTEQKPQDLFKLHLGMQTFEILRTIELGLHPYLSKDIVSRLPIYHPAHINVGVEILEARFLMPPHELVSIDFGNGVVYQDYKKQYTYFIDVTTLMTQLWARINALGIQVIEQEITNFKECNADIVANCTGLGSRELAEDNGVGPARGHYFMLKAHSHQTPEPYLLFAPFVRQERREYVSYFPKPTYQTPDGIIECAGMIGGTYIPCQGLTSDELQTLDEQELNKLKERALHYFYGQK